MKVACEQHPELTVFDLGVRFAGGEAEVEDAAVLRKLAAMEGFSFAFAGEIPAEGPEPEKKSSKKE